MNPLLILISVLLVCSAFLMAGRTRLRSLVHMLRIQALLLACYAVVASYVHGDIHLLIVAGLMVALKVIVMPEFLLHVARKGHMSERLPTYLRASWLVFLAAGLIGLATWFALQMPFEGGVFAFAVATSIVLIGFELLVTHKNLFGQGIGFLMLENGTFFLGLALVGGVPLVIEIGVLFDLLALLVLATALITRAQQAHASVATDYLTALKDL